MKYAKQYIKTAVEFIQNYDGAVPLNHYLKSKFSIEKKYGSKDRKHISHLCYAYLRLGHYLKDIDEEERIKAALFLLGSEEWKVVFGEDWLLNWHPDINKRITVIEEKYHQNISEIFPLQEELSYEIEDRK